MGIRIGTVETRNRVFLAPMSGITDAPFRAAAQRGGAGLVVSEMVASEELVRSRPDMVRRAKPVERPFVIQLAGREPRWMAEGVRIAQDLGADVIDINMGCPAREVAGKLSGSALMRDLDHAQSLIEATMGASRVPVTLKMRLGWDERSLNAPDLACRAEKAGVALITVHGRTRCQFYKGRADWSAIRAVKRAISLPLIANGDGETVADLRTMLALSGADGVMVGRSAQGRPWWPGVLAEALDPGSGRREPLLTEQVEIIAGLYHDLIAEYGAALGVRVARKHVGWAVERWRQGAALTEADASDARRRLLAQTDPAAVLRDLDAIARRFAGQRLAA